MRRALTKIVTVLVQSFLVICSLGFVCVADKIEVELAYAIGVAKPTSVLVDTFGTAKVDEAKIQDKILEIFDLTPKGIIKTLDLKRPIYKQTAAYGHFGRTDIDLPWEHLDKVDELKTLLK